MAICFFCGIFVEILYQSELSSITFSEKAFSTYIIDCLESNLFIGVILFLSLKLPILKNLILLPVIYKFFSLGFSTSLIIYNYNEPIEYLISNILFECAYTVPIYLLMIESAHSSINKDEISPIIGPLLFVSLLTLFTFLQCFLLHLLV